MNKRINLDPISFRDLYNDCLSTVTSRKSAFESYSDFVCKKQSEYLDLGKLGTFEDFDDFYINDVTHVKFEKDMVWLYENKFSKNGSVGRDHYDEILSSSKAGLCPYCLQRRVSQLDHFLPKTKSPSLSVAPENLVPSCSDCNFNKNNNTDLFINPHFEIIDDEIYLKCSIIVESGRFIFDYYLEKPSSWNDGMFSRLENQLLNANYSELYSLQASQLSNENKFDYKRRFVQYGKEELIESFQTNLFGIVQNVGPNYWKAAYCRAWIKFLETTATPFDFSERQILNQLDTQFY